MKYERLQELREDSDLTQKELGKRLHISQRAYSHYENGTRNIPIETSIRMAKYYDTSLDYLVGLTDKR